MEFKVGDRVRVCDGSADHWRAGVIDSIYAYSDTSNHLVLLDGEDECCGYSAHDLELIESRFKVGDRVCLATNPELIGRIQSKDPIIADRWIVAFPGPPDSPWIHEVDRGMHPFELRHLPTTHTRGTHPNSLANLAPGQERRHGWKEARLRLSDRACDWLRERRQGKGGMSAVVEGLIMEKISEEEKES
jgi:hypothetical protein